MPENTVLPCITAAWRHSFEKDPLQHLRKERQGRAREGGREGGRVREGGREGGRVREGGQRGKREGGRGMGSNHSVTE